MNRDDYILRITQATPAQLVVINYEIIIEYLREALDSYDKREDKAIAEYGYIKRKHYPGFTKAVSKAKDGLLQLMCGLNLEITIAQDLFSIYTYIDRLLNRAYFSADRSAAAEAMELAKTLLLGWREAAAKEAPTAAPVMDAPQVYAGLTYRKNGLEEYVDEKSGRGYKA